MTVALKAISDHPSRRLVVALAKNSYNDGATHYETPGFPE